MENKRDLSLDLVKVIAMIGVVASHCQLMSNHVHDTWSIFIISKLGSGYCIPLFIMVSGWLLIDKNVNYKYSIRKILNIFKFVAIILLLFWLLFDVWNGTTIYGQFKHFCYSFLQMGGYPIFWYFGVLCILYALLPAIHYFNKKHRYFLPVSILVLSVLESIIFTLDVLFSFEHDYVIQTFRIWNWLYYFLWGGFVKYILQKRHINIKLYPVIIMACIHLCLIYVLLPKIINTDCNYGSWECCIFVLLIFLYIMSHKIEKNQFIPEFSNLFLPVYALHLTIYQFYFKYVNTECLGEFSSILDFLIVLFSTMFISYVLMKIPYVNKIFRI